MVIVVLIFLFFFNFSIFLSRGYLIVLAAIVEKTFISPYNCFGAFIENDLIICLWVTKTFEIMGKWVFYLQG